MSGEKYPRLILSKLVAQYERGEIKDSSRFDITCQHCQRRSVKPVSEIVRLYRAGDMNCKSCGEDLRR